MSVFGKAFKRSVAAVLCVTAVACAAMTVPAMQAKAEQPDCTITFHLDIAGTSYDTNQKEVRDYLETHPDTKLDIHLHKVASLGADGHYVLEDDYKDVPGLQDVHLVDGYTKASTWESYAEAAMGISGTDAMRGKATKQSAGYADLSGDGCRVTVPGGGLYLADIGTMDAGDCFYDFKAYLIAVPGWNEDGTRLYDVTAGMKPYRVDKNGRLVITKTLEECRVETAGSTFVFEVTVKQGDKIVYNDVHSIVFDEHGSKSIEITGLPANSVATVTEIYSGSSYQIATGDDPTKTVTIPADGVANAAFKNDYNDNAVRNGASAVNHMTVTSESGNVGLKWEKLPSSKDKN